MLIVTTFQINLVKNFAGLKRLPSSETLQLITFWSFFFLRLPNIINDIGYKLYFLKFKFEKVPKVTKINKNKVFVVKKDVYKVNHVYFIQHHLCKCCYFLSRKLCLIGRIYLVEFLFPLVENITLR